MNEIPKEVMPIVRILRRDVLRPENPPSAFKASFFPRWNLQDVLYCPMGLHPLAIWHEPYAIHHFHTPIGSTKDIENFVNWWDSTGSWKAREKMNLIWPEDEE